MKVSTLIMVITLDILIFVLAACGSDGTTTLVECDNTKALMSVWTSNTTDIAYNMSAGAMDTPLEVKFGAGACDDGRGDFVMLVNSDSTVDFYNCAASTLTNSGTYSQVCGVLTINYNTGETESFR